MHESRPKLGEQLLNQHNLIARPSQFLWTRGSAGQRILLLCWLWKGGRNTRNYPRSAFRFTRATILGSHLRLWTRFEAGQNGWLRYGTLRYVTLRCDRVLAPMARSEYTSSEYTCRICLEPSARAACLAPCLCRGSQKYVHRECLNKWRAKSETAFSICPTCRFQYRLRRRRGGRPLSQLQRRLLLLARLFASPLGLLCAFELFVAGMVLCHYLGPPVMQWVVGWRPSQLDVALAAHLVLLVGVCVLGFWLRAVGCVRFEIPWWLQPWPRNCFVVLGGGWVLRWVVIFGLFHAAVVGLYLLYRLFRCCQDIQATCQQDGEATAVATFFFALQSKDRVLVEEVLDLETTESVWQKFQG
eukprot:g68742.t1